MYYGSRLAHLRDKLAAVGVYGYYPEHMLHDKKAISDAMVAGALLKRVLPAASLQKLNLQHMGHTRPHLLNKLKAAVANKPFVKQRMMRESFPSTAAFELSSRSGHHRLLRHINRVLEIEKRMQKATPGIHRLSDKKYKKVADKSRRLWEQHETLRDNREYVGGILKEKGDALRRYDTANYLERKLLDIGPDINKLNTTELAELKKDLDSHFRMLGGSWPTKAWTREWDSWKELTRLVKNVGYEPSGGYW